VKLNIPKKQTNKQTNNRTDLKKYEELDMQIMWSLVIMISFSLPEYVPNSSKRDMRIEHLINSVKMTPGNLILRYKETDTKFNIYSKEIYCQEG